jgi:hypothetical protein
MAEFFERWGFLLLLLLSVLSIILLLALGRKRVKYSLFDYSCLFVPFLSWFAGFNLQDNKSLSNPVAEPIILLSVIAIVLAVRVAIGKKMNEKVIAVSMLLVLLIAGFLLGSSLHALPE